MDVYNWASWSADVIAWDGAWGGTGWAGLASPVNYDGQHAGQMNVQINTTSGWGSSYNVMKAISCQEVGHAVAGILHRGPGCMGFSYQGQSPAASNNYNDPAVRQPSAHDREHAWFLYMGGFH